MKEIPLVLVHGYPFDRTMWHSTIAALGDCGRVFAPDVPGFGKVPLPEGQKTSLDAAAEDLAQLLDNNKYERAVVAGMSMGGYIALAFAAKFPKRLAGLGLISTQAAADTAEARQGRQAMIEKIRASGPAVAAEAMLPKLFAGDRPKNPDLAALPVQGAAAAGVEGLCWALKAMAERPDRTALVHDLNVPILVAHGTEDKIVPFAKARALAELCRSPIFVEMRGTGHASPMESPDLVASALARLMKEVRRLNSDKPVAS